MAFSTIPRLWRVVLLLSLAANLVVAGLVIGAAVDRHGPGRAEMRAPGPIAPLVRALPGADRRAVIGALRRDGPRQATRAHGIDTLLSAIRAEPFDPEAVTRALRDQRRQGEARLAAAETALAARLATMGAAERADYADALERGLRRHR